MGSRVHPRVYFPNPHPHPNPLGFYLYGFVGSRVINSPSKPDPTGSGSGGCPRVRVKLPSLHAHPSFLKTISKFYIIKKIYINI